VLVELNARSDSTYVSREFPDATWLQSASSGSFDFIVAFAPIPLRMTESKRNFFSRSVVDPWQNGTKKGTRSCVPSLLPMFRSITTFSSSALVLAQVVLAAPDAVPPVSAVADGPLPLGWSQAKLHFLRHLAAAGSAAILFLPACVGTSDHAGQPDRQTMPQSPPPASGLPVAAGRKRPCWSGECAYRTPPDPV
jgi:hypothetical protein